MKIEDKLVASVINGLKALYGQEVPEKMVQLQKTKKEFEGHLTLVVFPFLKMSRKDRNRQRRNWRISEGERTGCSCFQCDKRLFESDYCIGYLD